MCGERSKCHVPCECRARGGVEEKQVRGRFIMPEGPSKSNAENMKSSDPERACLNYAEKMRFF